VTDFVYLNGRPLVRVDTSISGDLLFFLNDHLGTPLVLVDTGRSEQWSAQWLPFAEIYDEQVSASNHIRFPGQWLDEESDLYKNWHRYYAPELGRYVEADPVHVLRQMNLYRYGNNNPTLFIDSSGEFAQLILAGAAVGGIIGGGFYLLTTDDTTAGGFAGAVLGGALAGGVGVLSPAIATWLGIGGVAGTAAVNAAVGLGAAGITASLDPCLDFTPEYALLSAVFGAAGGYVGGELFEPVGMENFLQRGFPRTTSGVIPRFLGGTAGKNAMYAIYFGGPIAVGVGIAGPMVGNALK
jgi:RHS repeat-associated protein